MWLWVYSICVCIIELESTVTDAEYALMPPVYHYDDFDRCMLFDKDSIYCSTIIDLSPVSVETPSEVWKTIEEASRPAKNFRHNKLRYGVCIYESCKELLKENNLDDYEILRKGIGDCYTKKFEEIGLKAEVSEMHVQKGRREIKWSTYDIFLLLCVLGGSAIVAWGTIYESLASYKSKEEYEEKTKHSVFGKLISCFSIRKNLDTLFSPFNTDDAAALKGIQGVRFFTMLTIMSTHTSIAVTLSGVYNTRYVEAMLAKPEIIVLLNNTFSCQAFLVVSGWLLSYHFFLTIEKNKTLKLRYLIMNFINRYIRLTPCLIALLMIILEFGRLAEPGPISYKTEDFETHCRKNWWSNILYINNYYDTKHMCAPHTWYLATDIQLYFLSLLILGIIWKFQKHTHLIFGVSLAIAVSIPGIINFINDYDIVVRFYPEYVAATPVKEIDLLRKMYIPAHTNIGAYILGLIFGYVFYKTRHQKVFTKKMHVYLWYVLVIFPPLIILCLGIPMFAENYVNSRFLAALYVSIARNAVAFSVALAIYGVSQGIGWIIRDISCWTPFQVLGKLCYCAYIFHPIIPIGRAVEQKVPSYIGMHFVAWQWLGDVTAAFILAAAASLCIELPLQSLQKLYIPQVWKKSTSAETSKRVVQNTID